MKTSVPLPVRRRTSACAGRTCGGQISSAGAHSSLTGGAYSAVDDLDPALASLLAECEQRSRAGEVIDIEKLAPSIPPGR